MRIKKGGKMDEQNTDIIIGKTKPTFFQAPNKTKPTHFWHFLSKGSSRLNTVLTLIE